MQQKQIFGVQEKHPTAIRDQRLGHIKRHEDQRFGYFRGRAPPHSALLRRTSSKRLFGLSSLLTYTRIPKVHREKAPLNTNTHMLSPHHVMVRSSRGELGSASGHAESLSETHYRSRRGGFEPLRACIYLLHATTCCSRPNSIRVYYSQTSTHAARHEQPQTNLQGSVHSCPSPGVYIAAPDVWAVTPHCKTHGTIHKHLVLYPHAN